MKRIAELPFFRPVEKDVPDYYLTPSQDFRQYTRDCEEKYWDKETAFDWQQDVPGNLMRRLADLPPEEFSRVAFMVLPMILDKVDATAAQIRRRHLPFEEDALKDIAECIPRDRGTIDQAIRLHAPLNSLRSELATAQDHLDILHRQVSDVRDQRRLGFYRVGVAVKRLETEAERQGQSQEIDRLEDEIRQRMDECKEIEARFSIEKDKAGEKLRTEWHAVERQVVADLEDTGIFLRRTLEAGELPAQPDDLARLRDLIWKRQLRGLKDIANHALVVEQSAIAPITMGVIHYRRHREIQEAMTTFINDEAKHSATFRRFLVEKLGAKEFISSLLLQGANRFMWISRYMPAAGFFIAVVVEGIGAASLEFFGNEKYMPDKLFCRICKTISEMDEKRHMDLCVAIYNEFYRKGSRWEKFRNELFLDMLMKAAYGNKTEDHRLIQAFRAFGIDSGTFYRQISARMSQQLTRIGMYVEPERFLRIVGQAG